METLRYIGLAIMSLYGIMQFVEVTKEKSLNWLPRLVISGAVLGIVARILLP